MYAHNTEVLKQLIFHDSVLLSALQKISKTVYGTCADLIKEFGSYKWVIIHI